MLHGIYVYLAGSSNNPQDLCMNMSDLQRGLKHAAGFCSLSDAGSAPWRGKVKSEAGPEPSSAAAHPEASASSDASSTQSSRNKAHSEEAEDNRVVKGQPGAPAEAAAVGGGNEAFHVPLRKVAVFLRQANLLPRLPQRYIQHQQRLGVQRKGAAHAQHNAPILPSLHVTGQVSQAWGFGTNTVAALRRHR
jgi:hypothetical protein